MERRNLLYGIILAVLGIAIVVVVVLILRKQSMLPFSALKSMTPRVVAAPTGTVPLTETRFERPWKLGDPEPPPEPETIETPETEEMKLL
jgi:hypothetical protein